MTATPKFNKRASPKNLKRRFNYQGRELTIKELAHEVGIPYNILYQRLRRGLSLEQAVSRKVQPPAPKPIRQLSREEGLLRLKEQWGEMRHRGSTMSEWINELTGECFVVIERPSVKKNLTYRTFIKPDGTHFLTSRTDLSERGFKKLRDLTFEESEKKGPKQ